MKKRIVSFVLLMVMMFSLVGCNITVIDNKLAVYKAMAISELESYAESKGQDNYFDESWETITMLCANAKVAIDEATNESEIESIVDMAKKEIDRVTNKEAYKASTISKLEAYTQSKGEENYFSEDWETIMMFCANAKLEIDEATNESEIESIVDMAKKEMDKVTNKEDKEDPKTWEECTEIKYNVVQNRRCQILWDYDSVLGGLDSSFLGVTYKQAIITSFNEWKTLIEKAEDRYTRPIEYYGIDISFKCLIEKYDERYFENKAIIVYEYTTPSLIGEINVINVTRQLTTVSFHVDIKVTVLESVDEGSLIIQVNKKDVQGVTNIESETFGAYLGHI